jgi:hypothetical protein
LFNGRRLATECPKAALSSFLSIDLPPPSSYLALSSHSKPVHRPASPDLRKLVTRTLSSNLPSIRRPIRKVVRFQVFCVETHMRMLPLCGATWAWSALGSSSLRMRLGSLGCHSYEFLPSNSIEAQVQPRHLSGCLAIQTHVWANEIVADSDSIGHDLGRLVVVHASESLLSISYRVV